MVLLKMQAHKAIVAYIYSRYGLQAAGVTVEEKSEN